MPIFFPGEAWASEIWFYKLQFLHLGKERVNDNCKWNFTYTNFILVAWIATKQNVLDAFWGKKEN